MVLLNAKKLVLWQGLHPTQKYGIDYEKTFAHIARLTSIHSLIAVVAALRWDLCQMDSKNVFLNSDLLEEVYM